jgi:hypothetical protein
MLSPTHYGVRDPSNGPAGIFSGRKRLHKRDKRGHGEEYG